MDYRCDYCRQKNRDECPDAYERERAATAEFLAVAREASQHVDDLVAAGERCVP